VTHELHYDVVVVGAGVAGLAAGARLAEEGSRVCVLAKGVGSTHLAPGTIDVLGYDPARVDSPERALPAFAEAHPDHPYGLLGVSAIDPALEWFRARVADGPLPGYRYCGGIERNHLLPSAVGALRPSALIPETMVAGDSAVGADVCVVGVRALRDFHASLLAANLGARALELDLRLGRAEANALGVARCFDDPAFRAGFVRQLLPQLGTAERVALPAVAGIRDPHGAWTDLERRLERRVFEVPTLPPSVPGLRLYNILRAALRGASGRLVLGSEAVGVERVGERVTAVRAQASGHEVRYAAREFVLATGGFASGGVALGADWVARESVAGLPVRAPPPGQPRFVANYFADQPMGRAGVVVDTELRPAGVENLRVVGAALAGAQPWREGSGEGIALTSAHRAASLVLTEKGSWRRMRRRTPA
jgi:glycerol-3-phosphate dehydrogenase subunit B